MNQITKTTETPEAKLRQQLSSMAPQFAMALPSHIKPEKLQRVVMTVAQQNPALLDADRRSLLGACLKCAADGLIPDGREAALVMFKDKVQYMPMMAGLLKRARNSGEIAGVIAQVIYERDEFIQTPDDFDHPIRHRPPALGQDRGKPIGAYALGKLKDGTVVSEVMSLSEIEKVRRVSRASGAGPWVQWWDEMARKTVFRRLSKWLPMDAEDADRVEQAMRRDDSLGAPQGDADAARGVILEGEAAESGSSRLDALEGSLAQADEDDFPGTATTAQGA
ncbi:recombinase RecT [Falsiroseomonas tokyonensis]|uniref:Recombinase RecT n=1 Tax=Falsiroseomonas tokyonensis TaxID=430521 RepID=A0ABV7C2F9_9PROT|nr:recombinase RecT [Falsiroseomonas tokyonensis]MBU8540851.1 recombinase RecT [Falsiroseomonas tokyonensis]